jgi:hypothetical protein
MIITWVSVGRVKALRCKEKLSESLPRFSRIRESIFLITGRGGRGPINVVGNSKLNRVSPCRVKMSPIETVKRGRLQSRQLQ